MTRQKRKYAIVDLEATNAGSNAKIIQVGIVIIEDGRIRQSYETDVNPHERLDEHIKQLTGLTDARLKKAPEFALRSSGCYGNSPAAVEIERENCELTKRIDRKTSFDGRLFDL